MATTITYQTFQSQITAFELLKHPAATPKEQKQLSPDLIRTFLGVSPEMKQINDLVDSKCSTLHEDDRLGCFSTLFKEIIATNKELFSSKTPPEKANILYKFHSDAIVQQISNSEKLPSIVDSFFQRLQDPYKNPEVKKAVILETERKLHVRVSYMHSGYVRFAVAAALEVPIKEIPSLSYEHTVETEELKKPSDMDIYRQ